MKAKKVIFSLILVVIIFICAKTTSPQLNERAIVKALGIDFENNRFVVTAQFYSPKSQNENEILVGKGATIFEAVWDINSKNSREIYLSHNSFVAISKDSINRISEILTYLNENPQVRPNVFLVAVENANETINLINQKETNDAKSLETKLKNAVENGTLCDMRLFEILRQREFSGAYTIPTLSVNDEEIVPNGTIALKNDTVVSEFDSEKTIGVNLIISRIKNLTLMVENVPVKITSSYSKISSNFTQNELTFLCDVVISAKIQNKNNFENFKISSFENEIKVKIQKAVNQIFIENNCDIFEFHVHTPKNTVNLTEKTEKKVIISVKCHFQ